MVNRHDILGRSYLQCTECGDVFLYQESQKKYAQICSACISSICDEPWNQAYTIFRALRPEEDPQENGLGARDPQANVTLSEHVEFGSPDYNACNSCSTHLLFLVLIYHV